MVEELVFIEEGHQYMLGDTLLPSVSEIIAPLGADLDDSDLELKLEAAAERGTTCHKILELYLNGDQEAEYPSEYEGYADGIRLFLAEHEIVPYAIEKPICSSELMVAGTPDLLCEYDGKLTVIDYKFVSQICKPKVKAQLNLYRKMLEEAGVFPEQLIAVQFLPDGLYRPYPVAASDAEYEACLQIYRFKNKKYARGKID